MSKPNRVRMTIAVLNTAAWAGTFILFGAPALIVLMVLIIVLGVSAGGLSLIAVTENDNGLH